MQQSLLRSILPKTIYIIAGHKGHLLPGTGCALALPGISSKQGVKLCPEIIHQVALVEPLLSKPLFQRVDMLFLVTVAVVVIRKKPVFPELPVCAYFFHCPFKRIGAACRRPGCVNAASLWDKKRTAAILLIIHEQHHRREIIVVDQHPILFTTTVHKNLEFGLKIRGIPKQERKRLIDETLDLVGMRYFARAQAQHLSGGETQRVAIARALALAPRVFLCDEPTANVDVENQNIIVNILKQINETRKITVLFTTHDRSQATELTEHTLVLDHGRLVATAYENVFTAVLEHDPRGKIRCVIQKNVSLPIPGLLLNSRKAGERVRVVIDPEKLDLLDTADDVHDHNIIRGQVVQINAENAKIRLIINGALKIAILITPQKYRQIRPLIGKIASVCIPAEAIQIL